MSYSIPAHHYTAQQAVLLQMRPSDLIEAVENSGSAREDSVRGTARISYEYLEPFGASLAGPDGSLVTALLPRTTRQTAAFESLADADKYQSANSWTRWAEQTKDALKKSANKASRSSTAVARLRVERLSATQAAFGFTIQDLASALAITRPQLYKWLDASNEIKLQEASRARLATVERIAKEWTLRGRMPLSSVSKEPLGAGGNVFTMLSADTINEADIVAAFDELLTKLQAKPKSLSQRLREAGFARRPSVRSLPSDE